MNMYRTVADRIGTIEASQLAHQLVQWHDAMVKHLRVMNGRRRRCPDECPHDEARTLWSAALNVFGEQAGQLGFLQKHGGSRSQREGPEGVEVYA
jgi:hypothetical protein